MPIIEWVLQENHIALCWLIYAILCFPMSYYMVHLLPARYDKTRYYNFIFLFVISISIFIFGILIACGLVILLHSMKLLKRKKEFIETAEYPDYQHSPLSKHDQYGEGFGFKVTTKDTLPKAIRQKMLVAINQFGTSNVNKINSMVLSDDEDEMRLYAKSLIEKQERELSHSIKKFAHELHQTKDIKQIATYKKYIALILWEQVYKYLVNNENLIAVLEKIKVLATDALIELPNDIDLPLLLAKIALRHQELGLARDYLLMAEKNKAPAYKVISYLAEIDFLEKKYSNIKKLLTKSNLKGIIGLQSIVSFWVGHD